MSALDRLPLNYQVPEPLPPETKWCPGCKQNCPGDNFSKNRRTRDGRSPYCRECIRTQQQKYYNKRKHERPWHRYHIYRTYGVTPEQVEALFEIQGNVCAICGSDSPNDKNWCVDHNHSTGAVRGILCGLCNKGLGSFQDNPETLRAAALYLDNH